MSKVSAAVRLKQFRKEGFVVQESKLWCTFCMDFVNHLKKSVVDLHVKSKKHIAAKPDDQTTSGTARGQTITECNENNALRSAMFRDMVSAFISAGIPLNVFTNTQLTAWIKKYVKGGCNLPCVPTLRKYLLDISQDDLSETIEMCGGKDVFLIVDESCDIKNRKVVNILVCPLASFQPCRLVSVTFIEICNAETIVELVLAALEMVQIKRENFVGFISDNAKYMLLAGTRLRGVCTRLTHSTCWAHILHLCAEEIRGKCKVMDTYISGIKSALVKAPSRRHHLQNVLVEAGRPSKLPPIPVITRWGTWLTAALYHHENFQEEVRWITESANDSTAMNSLKQLIGDDHLQQELKAVSVIAKDLIAAIAKIESRQMIASGVWLVLENILQLLNFSNLPSGKLSAYMNGKHPSVQFWRDVPVLDPRKGLTVNAIPPSLTVFLRCEIPLGEILLYKTLSANKEALSTCQTLQFWRMYGREMLHFSELALKALSMPCSSADVERSFSTLARILTPQRSNLTEQNLQAHLRVAFNQQLRGQQNPDEGDIEIESVDTD